MAERRMFAKTIIDSDAFIEMPMSARLLYYDLGMRADDDGFVNSPKKIMRMIGASNDDMNILIMRKFIIPFDSGVVVIKHWRINNYLRNDRYTETQYVKEKEQLTIDEKGKYHLGIPGGIPAVSTGKDSIGKDSIDKDNKEKEKKSRFIKPSIEEVTEYCLEKNKLHVDPETFVNYYESNGWMVGKNKMKDWKSAINTWERKAVDRGEKQKLFPQKKYSEPEPDFMNPPEIFEEPNGEWLN